MTKIFTALVALFAFVCTAAAQSTDYSLGASGWTNGPAGTTTYTGTQNLQAGQNAWAISPYTGSTMVGLTPTNPTATYNAMTTDLGMSAASVSALSGEIAAQNPQGGGNITNAAWVYKDFPLAAATKFSMYWVYTSTDYVPFNDGSITTFVNTTDAAALGKINNVLTQYILLGATNPGTGNYSTGSYGSTGWQIVNYEAVSAGTYRLGFASFNQGDTALSPVLYVNDGLGTVTKNGETFGAVAPNDPNMPSSPAAPPSSGPTVVSTAATDPTVSSSTAYGTSTTNNLVLVASTNTGSLFNVTKTTTPVTGTPYTITTISTPQVIQTWSDNTTTTIADPNNSATTTTQTGTAYQIGTSSDERNSASSATLKDMMAYRRFNPFIIDALSVKDGTWATPYVGYAKLNGSLRTTGASMGYNKTVENNSFGFGLRYEEANAHNYLNAKSEQTAYAGTAYVLTKQEHVWIKTSVGMSSAQYNTTTEISSFNLKNTNNVKQNNVYGDVTIYSAKDYKGFRPLFGATVQNSNVSSVQESGSPLLSTAPVKGSTNEVRPYAGVRYDLNETVGVESRVTYSKDFKTVSQNRVNVKKSITDNAYIELGVGFDRGSNYTAGVISAGLKINF